MSRRRGIEELGWGISADSRSLLIRRGERGGHDLDLIESVRVLREPLWKVLPVTLAMSAALVGLSPVIYPGEMIFMIILIPTLLFVGGSIATLEITSKAQKEQIFTRPIWVVARASRIINERRRSRRQSRSRHIDYSDDY